MAKTMMEGVEGYYGKYGLGAEEAYREFSSPQDTALMMRKRKQHQ